MGVDEQIKAEWEPHCSIAKVPSDGDILAMFRTSTGWKIEEKVLGGIRCAGDQGVLTPHCSEKLRAFFAHF